MLPQFRIMVSAEKSVENLGEDGCRSLGKLLHGPVLYTVWSRSLDEFETLDGFINLAKFV